jgi:hypothetical protein
MQFLNGFKTIIGAVGTIATPLIALGGHVGKIATDGVSALGPAYQTVEGAFLTLLALGIIHKTEKAKAAKSQ